jgi:hypothetical protein
MRKLLEVAIVVFDVDFAVARCDRASAGDSLI